MPPHIVAKGAIIVYNTQEIRLLAHMLKVSGLLYVQRGNIEVSAEEALSCFISSTAKTLF
jgi:hypothetical protein